MLGAKIKMKVKAKVARESLYDEGRPKITREAVKNANV